MSKLMRNEDAFTGLEAAIVLIAFIVVAAVFSYVILGAGFFTTQKSQEVVHSGVTQASSSLELIGDVYGIKASASTATDIDTLEFTLGLTAGGSVVDLSKTTLTYSDATAYYPLAKTTPTSTLNKKDWCIYVRKPAGAAGEVLEAGEQFIIKARLDKPIDVNHHFTLEVKPPTGATFAISRTTPPQIDTLNVLY